MQSTMCEKNREHSKFYERSVDANVLVETPGVLLVYSPKQSIMKEKEVIGK